MKMTDNWNDILQGHIKEITAILDEIESFIGSNRQANGNLEGLRAEKSRLKELLATLEGTEGQA